LVSSPWACTWASTNCVWTVVGWRGDLYAAKDLRRYVRRLIPQPAELERRLQVVYDIFKTKSYSGVLLFTDHMEAIWEEQLKHMRNGCLSDPHSVSLYWEVKKELWRGKGDEKYALSVWQTVRSTSQLESLHSFLKRALYSSTLSDEVFQQVLLDSLTKWTGDRIRQNGGLFPEAADLAQLVAADNLHYEITGQRLDLSLEYLRRKESTC